MMKKRKIVEINEELCNGCGQCVSSCAESAIRIIDGKARLVSDRFCDGMGACLGSCPTGALRIIEREADAFDESLAPDPRQASQCPSGHNCTFNPTVSADDGEVRSLSHWPVQIRLVSPSAPFLQRAHLLVTADCVPVAYPHFHRDFLGNRVVMVGCPKFDDSSLYVERFAEIFEKANIQSVVVVVMQVPCCQGLPVIVQRGMQIANARIPVEKVVVSLTGEILMREELVV